MPLFDRGGQNHDNVIPFISFCIRIHDDNDY